jgi:hypothetical protein
VVAGAAYTEAEPAGNGHIDPGETFGVDVTLRNAGQLTAEDVSVMLVSTNPNVEFLCCPLPVLEQIAPGDSAVFTGFQARLAPGTPLGNLQALAAQVTVGGDQLGAFPLQPLRVGTPLPVFTDPAATLDAWTPAGGWGLTSTAWSPPSSFTDSPIGNYPANANATLTLSSPLDLSDVLAPRLRFRSRWSIQPDFDFGQVLLSTNGTNWTALPGRYTVSGSGSGAQPAGQHGFEGTNLDWPLEEMDLSPWAGMPTIHLQFRLRSNAATQRDGWWVDDIVVEGLVNGGTTAAESPAGAGDVALSVAPNPTRGPVVVTMTLQRPMDARVEVFDGLGRRVATLHDGPAPAGARSLRWDGGPAGQAAAGVYLVRLEADGRVAMSRFSVLR